MGKNKFLLKIISLFFAFNVYSQTTTVTRSICDGDSIFLQGAWQKNAGTYTDITGSGTIVTTLFIDPLPVITPNFVFNGNAVVQAGNVYQLTQAVNTQAGSVWNNVMINLNKPFKLDVEVFLGCSSGGADGIAFVLQPVSTSLGSSGGGIGYQNISPSFSVEFDTWLNRPFSDPWYNHVAIQKNGNLNHSSASNLAGPVGFPPSGFTSIEDCKWHEVSFEWNPVNTNFTLEFDSVQILNYTGDIVNTIFNGNPYVYWGFTGSTGAANNLQRFKFNYDVPDTSICENDTIKIKSLAIANSYSYKWSPNYNISNDTISAPLFFPDRSTLYNLDVTNSFGCTYSDSFTVYVDTTATIKFPNVPQMCVGDSAINLNLLPIGGTLTGTGLVGVSNGIFTPSQTNVGSYELTYSYTNPSTGCNDSKTQDIIVNDSPVLNATYNNVSSCLGNDGSIDISVSGGNNPISYLWNNGEITQDLDSISAGNYSLLATDINGCKDSFSVNITQPNFPTIIYSKNNASCFGFNDGSIDITVFGGQIPYSYNWSNGSISEDLNNLSAGFYYLTVQDANNCEVSIGVTIDQPNEISISKTTLDVLCFGEDNGSVRLNISGGVSPYLQNWNGYNPNNLYAGTYLFSVIDSTGCIKNDQVTINQPDELNVLNSSISVSCYGGSDGKASLIVDGGTLPYNYNWYGNNPNNLSLGTYRFTVFDFNGCSYTDSIYISEPTPLQVSTNINNVTCFGYNDGFVTLNISGGTLPYSQNWGPYNSNSLYAGTYNFDVTDSNGCLYNDVVTISEPLSVIATIDTFMTTCFGYDDGFVKTSYSGGTPPYVEDWGSYDPNNLAAGTYNFSVSDSASCVYQFQAIITQPNEILINEVTTNVSCFGLSDGTASLSITGGKHPFSVDWGGFDTNNLSAGIYIYSVNDANGCQKNSFVNITQPDSLQVLEKVTDVSCFNYNDGSVVLYISGGTPPYIQNWNGYIASELYTGDYNYDVVDFNGCTYSSTIFVDQADKIKSSFNTSDEICEGDSIHLSFDIINPKNNFYYTKVKDSEGKIYEFTIDSLGNSISFNQELKFPLYSSGNIIFELISDEFGCQSGIFDSSFVLVKPKPALQMSIDDVCIGTPSFNLTQATPVGGVYKVSNIVVNKFNTNQLGIGSHEVKYNYLDLTSGCKDSISKVVKVYDSLYVDLRISPLVTDSINSNVYFNAISDRATQFNWYVDTLFLSNESSFWHNFDRVGEYKINLFVYDDVGCSDSLTSALLINPVSSVFIPNSFTPSLEDEINNYFGPITHSSSSFIIRIFNGWGQKIYESSEFWDGKVNNKFVPSGTYTYNIDVFDFKGSLSTFSGKLQIIR